MSQDHPYGPAPLSARPQLSEQDRDYACDPHPEDFAAPNDALDSDQALPDQAVKGRGAVSNATGRFEPETRIRTDDGWNVARILAEDEEAPPLRTTVQSDTTRTVIAKNDSPDISFNQSINPYRGCEHGCIYCFARPTHAYLGYSPGLDFETKLVAKFDGPKLLEEELRKPGYQCQVIAMGTNTDPYQPIERKHEITRGILKVLQAYNHPIGFVTKSALILRDLDILVPMAKKGLAHVFVSLTTLDPELARTMEPRASSPHLRLKAIKELNAAGVPCGVMTAPMIPGLNDAEMEKLLEAARDAGARRAGYVLLRLPHEIKDLFAEWLWAHYPLKAEHVLSLVKSTRGGKMYDSRFGTRQRGEGRYAELLKQRFDLATKRLGLNLEPRGAGLRTDLFERPARPGDQLRLL